MTKIAPALTPDAWAKIHKWKNHGQFAVITIEGGNSELLGMYDADESGAGPEFDEQEVRTAVAAIAALNDSLPDSDPRKITRAHVAAIRHELDEEWDGIRDDASFPHVALLRQLADALESYLPPET